MRRIACWSKLILCGRLNYRDAKVAITRALRNAKHHKKNKSCDVFNSPERKARRLAAVVRHRDRVKFATEHLLAYNGADATNTFNNLLTPEQQQQFGFLRKRKTKDSTPTTATAPSAAAAPSPPSPPAAAAAAATAAAATPAPVPPADEENEEEYEEEYEEDMSSDQ